MRAMVSPHRDDSLICVHVYARGARAGAPNANARLIDPRFPREPGVIGAANRAMGAREKHRAAPKALTISLDAGGNRVSGLRTLDHDHTHVALPENLFFVISCKKVPAGWRPPDVGAGTWGASRTLSDRASGSGAHARNRAYSYRPDPSSNEPWTLSAAFLAGSMKNVAEMLPDRLTRIRRVQRDFHFAFTHGTNILSGESIPRDARPRHESSRSVFDQILDEP